MKNQVKKSNFIKWYLDTGKDFKDAMFNLQENIILCLIANGEITLTVKDFFDMAGYIPQDICVNDEGTEEYDPSEVELID